jgi:hypothetical protein
MPFHPRWRDETESEQQRHCEKIGFDDFTDVKPFYPKIRGVRRLKSERDNGEKSAVRSKKSSESRDLLRRKRKLSSSTH